MGNSEKSVNAVLAAGYASIDELLQKEFIENRRTTREIQRIVRISYSTVQEWIRVRKLTRPKLTPGIGMQKKAEAEFLKHAETVKKMYLDGKTPREIMTVVDSNETTVRKWLKKLGVFEYRRNTTREKSDGIRYRENSKKVFFTDTEDLPPRPCNICKVSFKPDNKFARFCNKCRYTISTERRRSDILTCY